MTKLSIIMPVYNTEKYLNRAIEAVLSGKFVDFELILVNDGSKDNSLDICRAYEKKDCRVVVIDKENGGAGSARNAGLEVARGEFVVFPDSDDWIDPEAYDFCITEMESQNLDLILFGSLNTVYDENDAVIKEVKGRTENIYLSTQDDCRAKWAWLVRYLPMDGPSNKMYRTAIIRENHIRFPNLRRMQDGVFNMRYFDKVCGFKAVNQYFYHFTQHSSEFQRKKMPSKFIDCAISYHQEAISYLKAWGKLTKENERLFGEWFSEMVFVAEFEYLPDTDTSFGAIYRHIFNINNIPYIHLFYKKYGKLTKLMKKEKAILYKLNFILAIDAIRKV